MVALDGVDFEVTSGEFTAIMGPSGSGKSTLMHLLAALDSPTSGKVFIGDTDVASLKDTPLTELRRERIGFIFQAFNLVPTLNARENIVLPLAIANKKVDQEWFDRIVDVLGLGDRLTHKPSELSGGQQQRVACARALMNRPDIIFGDEPTGNLDSASAAEVLGFLRRSVDEFGQTIVMVTHDALSASYADRQVFLSDGRIIKELRGASQDELLSTMAIIYPRQDRKVHNSGVEAVQDDATVDSLELDESVDGSGGESIASDDDSLSGEVVAVESQDVLGVEPEDTAAGYRTDDAKPVIDASEELHDEADHDDMSPVGEYVEAAPEEPDSESDVDDSTGDSIYREGGGAPEPERLDENSETVMEQTIPRRAISG